MLWTNLIEDVDGEEIAGVFYEKEFAKDKSNRV